MYILIAGAILVVLAIFLSYLSSHKKNEGEKYVHGTGKTLIHKQGWGTSSAMDIIERNRLKDADYKNVVFARILGVTKTKDIVRNGVDEYTYMIECWETA